MFADALKYVLELGPTVMLPIVILLFSLGFGMRFSDAFRSALHIGIGFVGIILVIDLMLDSIGPAAQHMAELYGIELSVVDIGWPGSAPIAWASEMALIAIPVAIAVNVVMLITKMTRVVNVDIWNIWHMAFTGAMVHVATGSYLWGIIGISTHAVIAYKLGDWFAQDTKNYFELDGIAVPHGTSAYCAPIAVLVNDVIEKIPVVRDISFSTDTVQKRFGSLGEPITVGFCIGLVIGMLADYEVKDALQLAVKTAAVMLLIPRVIKPIMDGLMPISKHIRKRLQDRFGGKEYLIGLDPALLLGQARVVSTGLLFIPLSIFIAVMMPGNTVLPFGDLATISFFIAMVVAVHNGNLFRTLISGSIIMAGTLWIATQTIPYLTQLGQLTGHINGNKLLSSLDQGGAPITYLLIEGITLKNIAGLMTIGAIYSLAVFMTWRRAKRSSQ